MFEVVENQRVLPVVGTDGVGEADIIKLVRELREIKETLETMPRPTVMTAEAENSKLLQEVQELKGIMQDAMPRTAATVEENLQKIHENATPSSTTYAAAVARPHHPKHTIIISSQKIGDTSDDVLSKIRGAVDARNMGVQVAGLRKAKRQKILISCEDKKDLGKIADNLKRANAGLNVEEAKSKDPLVIIKNVLAYNTDEDILKSLKTQNSKITKDIPETEYRAIVKYRRRTRNTLENHVILQVSPKFWQKLTAAAEVHIDLQRCAVMDQSPLIQCTKCLAFGHGRRLCKESVELCSHCSGPHLKKDCPAWLAGDDATCRNCSNAKLDHHGHGAFDTSCPIRRRWDVLARSSVAYC